MPCDSTRSLGWAWAWAASALEGQEMRLWLRLRAAPELLPIWVRVRAAAELPIRVYLFFLPAARQGKLEPRRHLDQEPPLEP